MAQQPPPPTPTPQKPGIGKGFSDLGRAAVAVGQAVASTAGSVGRGTGQTAGGVSGLAGRTLSGVGNFVTNFATNHKNITTLIVLYTGLKTVQHFLNKRKERKAEQAFGENPSQLPPEAQSVPSYSNGQGQAQSFSSVGMSEHGLNDRPEGYWAAREQQRMEQSRGKSQTIGGV